MNTLDQYAEKQPQQYGRIVAVPVYVAACMSFGTRAAGFPALSAASLDSHLLMQSSILGLGFSQRLPCLGIFDLYSLGNILRNTKQESEVNNTFACSLHQEEL